LQRQHNGLFATALSQGSVKMTL